MSEIVTCGYCHQPAELVAQSDFYGSSRYDGWMYICRPCDARVGCHPRTKTPLGTLANLPLRAARTQAHAVFDPLWLQSRNRRKARAAIYRELEQATGVAHIGETTKEQCARVVEWAREFAKGNQ